MAEVLTSTYFGKAQALASIAERELEQARLGDDKIKARQAAGKAWLAIGEAFRGLLFAKGVLAKDFPRSERGRVFLHTKYGSRLLKDNYCIAKAIFHQDAYYEEIIDFDNLARAQEALREYLAEARRLAEG